MCYRVSGERNTEHIIFWLSGIFLLFKKVKKEEKTKNNKGIKEIT